MFSPHRVKLGFRLFAALMLQVLLGAAMASAQVSAPDFNRLDRGTVTITISNNSNNGDSAEDIVVKNTIPASGFSYVVGSSLVTGHDSSTSTTDPGQSNLDLTWDIDTLLGDYALPDGEILTITFDLETDCNAQGSNNTDTVEINYTVNGGAITPPDTASTNFNVNTGAADLTIAKVGANGTMEIDQCDERTYLLTVTNNGNDGAALNTITDTLPQPGFSYVDNSAVVTYPNGSTVNLNPNGPPGAPVWELDDYPLGAGDTITIEYDVATNCYVPGNLRNDLSVTYTDCNGSGEVTGLTNYELSQGVLFLTKTPEVAPATVGDTVIWTITAENTGEGAIRNVVVSDNWEDGLGNLVVDSVPSDGTISYPTTDSFEVTFPEILPGESKSIAVTLEVLSCDNLSNYADASWGCGTDICYNSKDEDETILASVELKIKEPLISFTVPDILIEPYCSDGSEVTIPITNSGDGDARVFELYVDFTGLDISDVSGDIGGSNVPMVYGSGDANAGANAFTSAGDPITIPAGGTLNITFTVNYPDWCQETGSGNLIYEPYYSSGCDEGFAPPVLLGSYEGTPNKSSLTVTKTGPGVIDLGGQGTYTITADYTQPPDCAGNYPTSATIVDTIPDGWTIIAPSDNPPDVIVSGNTITWNWNPAEGAFSEDIILAAPDGCGSCNTVHENSVVVTLTDCCDCALTADATQTTVLRCNDSSVDSTRTATPASNCGTITYTNTYGFAADSAADYSTLTFTDDNGHDQQYAGNLSVIANGNDITSSVVVADNTPGGTLEITGFSGGSTAGTTLVISYDMKMTSDTTTPCSGASFYSWAGLNLGPGTGTAQCPDAGDTSFAEVVVQPPGMTASVGTLPFFADKCATFPITLTFDRTSGRANPYDVRAELVLNGYKIVNTAADPITCSGVAPDDCTPADLDDPEWRFGDRFAASAGTEATIDLRVQAPCPGGGELVTTVYYDDQCDEDSDGGGEIYGDSCTSTGTNAAGAVLEPNLVIKKTAEQVFTTNNEVKWVIYVSNIGAGTAYNLEVADTLDDGINYTTSSFDSNDPAFTPGDETTLVTGQTVTWTLPSLAPGRRAEIEITGTLVDCDNLNNNVSASWGCLGEMCRTVTDSALVLSPAKARLLMQQSVDPVEMCGTTTASILVKNVGVPYAYNLTVKDLLPSGVSFVTDSAQYSYNGAAFKNAPNPTGSDEIIWAHDAGTGGLYDILKTMRPKDTLEITFDLAVDCEFVDGTLDANIEYENPCGAPGVTPSAVGLIQLSQPELTVVSTRAPQIVDCGDDVTWTIEITNNGTTPAQLVQITDELGGDFTFKSLSPGSVNYTTNNNVISWEFGPLAVGATETFDLVATLNDTGTCDPAQIFNNVKAQWGCGTPDNNPATEPDCLTEIDYSDNDAVDRAVPELQATVAQNELEVCLEAGDPNNTITVTLENVGDGKATGIDATIALPDGMGLVSGSVTLNGGSVTPVIGGDGNDLVFFNGVSDVPGSADDLPDLEVGGSHVIAFRVTTSCAKNGDTGDIGVSAVFEDCCGTPITPYTPTPHPVTWKAPDIVLTKTQVDPANNGAVSCTEAVTWEIKVENNGLKDADIVRLTDTLGDAFEFDGNQFYVTSRG